jgi:hypothetical protein
MRYTSFYKSYQMFIYDDGRAFVVLPGESRWFASNPDAKTGITNFLKRLRK